MFTTLHAPCPHVNCKETPTVSTSALQSDASHDPGLYHSAASSLHRVYTRVFGSRESD